MSASLLAAGAHSSGRAAVGDPWAFHFHLSAWLAIATLALGYALAVRRMGMRSGPSTLPTRRQLRYLAGGLLALVLALTWPLADLAAHWSLTALVVQRLLLTLGAAPLLLLATPSPLLARLTRPAAVDACLAALTRPVVAVATFTVVAVGTLITPAVAAQASSGWWRAFTDAALLLAGVVLWGPVLRHIPGAHRTAPVAVAAYLFIQSVVPTFPAIIYVFARHPLYDAFHNVRVAFGISRLVDQQLAGVVAKVATLPVLWSVAWVALMRAQRVENAAADGDDGEPLTWAEVERQLERAERAERKGRAQKRRRRHAWAIPRPLAPWADPDEGIDRAGPIDPAEPIDPPHLIDPADPAEPRSPTDGPGSPDA
jgi:putative membrane protein